MIVYLYLALPVSSRSFFVTCPWMIELGFFNPDYVNQLLEQHFNLVKDNSRPIWGLLTFMLWHRTFMEQAELKGPRRDRGCEGKEGMEGENTLTSMSVCFALLATSKATKV